MTAVGLGRSTPFGSLQVGGAIAAGSQHPPSRLIWIPVGPKCLGTDRAHLARGLPRYPRRPRLPGCPLLDDRASLLQETLAHGPGDRRRRRGAGLALRPDSKVRSLRRDGGPRGRRLWCPQPRRDRGQHGPEDRTSSINWVMPLTVGGALGCSFAAERTEGLALATGLAATYTVTVAEALRSETGRAATAVANIASYPGFVLVGHTAADRGPAHGGRGRRSEAP